MKVKDHPKYKAESPETFAWSLLDSWKLEVVACRMARDIKQEMAGASADRVNSAGLRAALNIIAEEAELL